MAIDTTVWNRQLAACIAQLPSVLTYKGATVACTRPVMARTDDVASEGVYNLAEGDVACNASAFDDVGVPEPREVVDVDGVRFHVSRRLTDGVSVVLSLRRV